MWLSQFKSKKGQALAVPLLYWIFVVTCDGISADDEQIVQIDRLAPATYHTRTNFLSITLDSSTIGNGFNVFNMTDTKLIKMMGHLSPGFLRVGGTLGDRLYFSPDSVEVDKNVDLQIATNFTMTGAQWLQLTDLAKQANLDVIFQLNALMRLSDGSWDYSNAETLISFSDEHKLNLDWELGNEPDIFHQQFNEEVNTTQLAKDFATLRSILDKYETYKESQLFGPDTTWPSEGNKYYIRDFVKDASHVIDAVTWHHYYMNGHTAKAEDFLNPKIFDDLSAHIKIVKDAAKEVNASSVPIWLGETSSAYGGGAPNLSDIFIASFLWVDKLGVSAKMGLELVARQSIVDYNYALLDKSYNPNPIKQPQIIFYSCMPVAVIQHVHSLIKEQ
ncbi:hypothetical protein NQ318_015765 [Aromia moschata]|uniref:Uncharacterized protein n=1 Tax=Aromia moschata TaxID=1265417 RepID=A0AAV8XN64_9CUCU|nr:hypothetical protein NQ318_015765 [Aromia moschata]